VRIPDTPGRPPLPWILGNPIYVVPSEIAEPAVVPARLPAVKERRLIGPTGGEHDTDWTAERDETSRAELRREDEAVELVYALGEPAGGGPYAAAVAKVTAVGLSGFDRLSFTARANRPMRISVQMRVPGGPDGHRWQRSAYVDGEARDVTIFFDEMTPAGPSETRRPALERVDSLLFVVDTTHTPPGASGTLRLERVRLSAPEGRVPNPPLR
jgi:hypothetical protein